MNLRNPCIYYSVYNSNLQAVKCELLQLCWFAQKTWGVIVNFYDTFVYLCSKKGISPSAALLEMGFQKSVGTRWKKGMLPRDVNLHKVANYFNVPISYFYEEEPYVLKSKESSYNYSSYAGEPMNKDGSADQLSFNRPEPQNSQSDNDEHKEKKIEYNKKTKKMIVPTDFLSPRYNNDPKTDLLIKLLTLREKLNEKDSENLNNDLENLLERYLWANSFYESGTFEDDENLPR